MPATLSRPAGGRAPMVLLHGIGDSSRTWDLVRPGLERWHEVLAPTLPGHLALLLAARGRAESVVALAPAGGWSAGDPVAGEVLRLTERIRSGARATAGASGFEALTAPVRRDGWPLDGGAIGAPVRVLWGTADRLLPWPDAAQALRRALPRADWIELDGVGHHPQLEVPLETAELILGLSAPGRGGPRTPHGGPA